MRLKRLVPYDSIAVYVLRDQKLVPEYVNGENFRLFSSLEIPVGEGLSGWVAQNRKPILNGNPSVEAGYMGDPDKFSTLRSALAVPLEGLNGAVGVLALYRAEKDAFTTRQSAHPAGHQLQGFAGHRKRAEVSPGRKFGHHRLPYQPAQRALAVPAPG